MKKLTLALAVVSVLIVVVPVAALVFVYSDNLMDTVIPQDIKSAFNSGLSSQSKLYPQVLSGAFNSENTVTFQLKIANPLTTKLTVTSITADVVGFDDNKAIANITLTSPVTIEAGKSATLQVSGSLAAGLDTYFDNYASGGYPTIHLALKNLTVMASGLQICIERQDAGYLSLGGLA
jgi:LEA14-like dessication related protein